MDNDFIICDEEAMEYTSDYTANNNYYDAKPRSGFLDLIMRLIITSKP